MPFYSCLVYRTSSSPIHTTGSRNDTCHASCWRQVQFSFFKDSLIDSYGNTSKPYLYWSQHYNFHFTASDQPHISRKLLILALGVQDHFVDCMAHIKSLACIGWCLQEWSSLAASFVFVDVNSYLWTDALLNTSVLEINHSHYFIMQYSTFFCLFMVFLRYYSMKRTRSHKTV